MRTRFQQALIFFFGYLLFLPVAGFTQAPTINSFTPGNGTVGTLVTISGADLSAPTSIQIGGVTAIVISGSATQVTAMVMPGAVTGPVSLGTAGGTVTATGSFIVNPHTASFSQLGNKHAVADGQSPSGYNGKLAISADGNTAIVGLSSDDDNKGAAWVYTRIGSVWTLQGNKLVGTGAAGNARQGSSVAISADGNTVVIGGPADNGNTGAVWIFHRTGSDWVQQGNKLVGVGGVGIQTQGASVSISGDGNIIFAGGMGDDSYRGAVWVFTRTGTVWAQLGSKLTEPGLDASSYFGRSVTLSADGKTGVISSDAFNDYTGAVWFYTLQGGIWVQDGARQEPTTSTAQLGSSVAINADGTIALATSSGTKEVQFYKKEGGAWTLQSQKLVTGEQGQTSFGTDLVLSADGRTAVVSGSGYQNVGAAWFFIRNGNDWSLLGKRQTGTGNLLNGEFGNSIVLSADGNIALAGGQGGIDANGISYPAVWTYARNSGEPPAILSFSPATGPIGTMVTINGTDLTNAESVSIGGTPAIILSSSATHVTAMVMPGTTTGQVTFRNHEGVFTSTGSFTVTNTTAGFSQLGDKRRVSEDADLGGSYGHEYTMAISADGKTAIVGQASHNNSEGAVWIYTRNGPVWSQQGTRLVGTGSTGSAGQGSSVAISADGNTAVVGAPYDNDGTGTVWIFQRNAGSWTQVYTIFGDVTPSAYFGHAVSVSADGNTVMVGAPYDNDNTGSVQVFQRIGSVWHPFGTKLIPAAADASTHFGRSVAISADGKTAVMGTESNSGSHRSIWFYQLQAGEWVESGNITADGSIAGDGTGTFGVGRNVAINADGTVAVASAGHGGNCSVWFYTRGNGTWKRAEMRQIPSSDLYFDYSKFLALSADGNTAAVSVGGFIHFFTRVAGDTTWSSLGEPQTDSNLNYRTYFGKSIALSADGSIVWGSGVFDIEGSNINGGGWTFIRNQIITASGSLTPFTVCSGTASSPQMITITGSALTHNVTVTAPSQYEISNNAASGYADELVFTPSGGELSQPVYIRLKATATAGVLTGTVACASVNAESSGISVTGTVHALPVTPVITADGSLSLCVGQSVVLHSDAPAGNEWLLNGSVISTATTTSYTATGAGIYSVRVTDVNNCVSADALTKTVVLNTRPVTPVISNLSPLVFCAGNIVVLSSDASSGNQWLLNGSPVANATATTFTATTSGNYSLRVTDGNNCTSADGAVKTVTVHALPATPVVSETGQLSFCAGGSVLLQSNAPDGNQWLLNGSPIPGVTTTGYTANVSGNYSVRVTDGNNCTSADAVVKTVTVHALPATPVITAAGTLTFCDGGSVVLQSNSSTGNQWLLNGSPVTNATASTFTAATSGNYSLRLTDGNNCTSTAATVKTVTVHALPATPVITAVGTLSFCDGGSVVLQSNSSAGNQWLLNGSPVTNATATTFTATASGNYSLRVTDSNNCTSTDAAVKTVTVHALPATPVITAAGTLSFCDGGSVVLQSNSSAGNQWLLNGAPVLNAVSANYTATVAGDYSLRITDANNCISADAIAKTVTVYTVPTAPVITAVGSLSFCEGDSVLLKSNAAEGNQWLLNGLPVANATGQMYTVTTSGNYSVKIGLSSNCNSAEAITKTITVHALPAQPVITAESALTFCKGGSVILGSDMATGIQWLLDGKAIDTATKSVYLATSPGIYSIRMTDTNNCVSESLTKTVTVYELPPTPEIKISGNLNFCTGDSLTLISSASSGNQWLHNGHPVDNATDSSYTIFKPGEYRLLVTDVNNCSNDSASAHTVVVYTLPVTPVITPAGPLSFNNGGSVVLNSSSGIGNQWLMNGSLILHATADSYTVSSTGDYSVLVTDNNGCSSDTSAPVSVTVHRIPATPVITANGATTFCSGGQVELRSSYSTGNQWLLNGVPIAGANSNTYTATATGDYSVRFTDANNNTSENAVAIIVTVHALPATPAITAASAVVFCAGNSVVLQSSATSGNQWLLNGSSITGATAVTYTASATGDYSLMVNNANNCSSLTSNTIKVTVNSLPAGSVSQISLPSGVLPGFTLTAPSGLTYLWSTGETSASILAQVSGNYSVTVANTQGCTNQFASTVVVPAPTGSSGNGGSTPSVSVPNTFSPNGDGANDKWAVPGLATYPRAQVTIMDRNGLVVFQSSGSSIKWDGKYKGKDLPSGVYFYSVLPAPGVAPVKGWVNLLR